MSTLRKTIVDKSTHLRIFTSSDYWSNKFGLKPNYGDNRKIFRNGKTFIINLIDLGIDLNAPWLGKGGKIKYVSRVHLAMINS